MSSRYPYSEKSVSKRQGTFGVGEKQQQRESPALFVGGIPKQANREEVFDYLTSFGTLVSFSMPYNGIPSNHKGFAKITFSTIQETEYFLALKNLTLKGLPIGVKLWESKAEHISLKEMPSENKLFLRMRSQFSMPELETYFSQFGEIDSIQFKTDYKTNNQRKIGFVIFKSPEAAKLALELGRTHIIDGNKVMVQESKSRQEIAKYIKTQKKSESKVKNKKKKAPTSTEYLSIEEQFCKQAAIDEGQLHYKLPSFGSSNQESFDYYETQLQLKNYCSYENMPDQDSRQKNPHFKKNEVSVKIRRAQPVPKLPDTGSSDAIKPCSKNWHHSSVIQNHKFADNLVFRIIKGNNPAYQGRAVANAIDRFSHLWNYP